jgi:hypothetical protein
MSTEESELKALERIFERLTMTSNEDLSNVLAKLLPKLLPMMNRDILRPMTIKILSNVTKRVKLLGTKLPCVDLIKLVHPSWKPFSCNFAIVLIDISLLNENEQSRLECAVSLVDTLSKSPFTSDAGFVALENSLVNYSSYLLPQLSRVLLEPVHAPINPIVTHTISDWLLDIALYSDHGSSSQPHTVILPGLSSKRIDRMREKNDTPLKLSPVAIKRQLVTHLHEKWIHVKNIY